MLDVGLVIKAGQGCLGILIKTGMSGCGVYNLTSLLQLFVL